MNGLNKSTARPRCFVDASHYFHAFQPANRLIQNLAMQRIHLLFPAAVALIASSCANMKKDDYDTPGYGFEDYGTPDGAPAEAVNPTYDTPPAYEDTAATPAPEAPAPRAETRHTVVRGDSLWSISRKYGVSIDAIKQANNLRSDTAVLGAKLIIPSR
jgi:hypothetical protein